MSGFPKTERGVKTQKLAAGAYEKDRMGKISGNG
jgi:hypothetical protein